MDSELPAPVVQETNAVVEDGTGNRCCPRKKKGKVPKRIHKAEREKLKREQLNDLFLDLASALELTQPNNGKASMLCETTRLLKDLFTQIECLKKENAALLSESHYVTVERNELREENTTLENQIGKLQSELETRVAQSKPYLNVPSSELQQLESTAQLSGDSLRLPVVDGPSPQTPTVFVVPIRPDLQAYPVTNSHVSKPHARYPTPADSWPSQLLGEQ